MARPYRGAKQCLTLVLTHNDTQGSIGASENILSETVWKVLGRRDGGLRSGPCRAGDTLRICPTTNGVALVRIFPSPQGGDVLQRFALLLTHPHRRCMLLLPRRPPAPRLVWHTMLWFNRTASRCQDGCSLKYK